MTQLLIDDNAIELLKSEMIKENAFALRIFVGGGGCCKHFEIMAVKKALTGDVSFMKGGIRILLEKQIAQISSDIHIKYDEYTGLLIDLT